MSQFLSILVAITLFSACSNSKKATENAEIETATETSTQTDVQHVPQGPEHQIIFEDIAEGDSLFASINKGFCFGTCPVYEILIYNSGYVEYNGRANVTLTGKHKTTIKKEQMIAFIDKANEIGYMSMDDEYDNPMISDLPETKTSLVMNGKRKHMRRRYGYPRSVLTFEKLFENLIASEKWEKITDDKE